jgi:hypothetical protein
VLEIDMGYAAKQKVSSLDLSTLRYLDREINMRSSTARRRPGAATAAARPCVESRRG